MPWGISQVRKVLFTIHIIFKLYPGESTLDGVIKSKVPVKNRGEDAFHGLLIKRLNADDIQVAQKARGHHVASSSRRSHCTQHQDILQFQNTGVLSIRKKTCMWCWKHYGGVWDNCGENWEGICVLAEPDAVQQQMQSPVKKCINIHGP